MFASPKFCYKCTTTVIQHLYYTSRETLSSNLPNSESESPSESSSRKKNPSSNRPDICFCNGGLYSLSPDSGTSPTVGFFVPLCCWRFFMCTCIPFEC